MAVRVKWADFQAWYAGATNLTPVAQSYVYARVYPMDREPKIPAAYLEDNYWQGRLVLWQDALAFLPRRPTGLMWWLIQAVVVFGAVTLAKMYNDVTGRTAIGIPVTAIVIVAVIITYLKFRKSDLRSREQMMQIARSRKFMFIPVSAILKNEGCDAFQALGDRKISLVFKDGAGEERRVVFAVYRHPKDHPELDPRSFHRMIAEVISWAQSADSQRDQEQGNQSAGGWRREPRADHL